MEWKLPTGPEEEEEDSRLAQKSGVTGEGEGQDKKDHIVNNESLRSDSFRA